MSENSKIEWTTHTFNPWEGCTKVSPGCLNCYAENRNARFGGGEAPNWGKGAPRRRTSEANWNLPLKWNREAGLLEGQWSEREGEHETKPARPRVFCASLADWLDDEVPIEWLVALLALIEKTPHLDWLLLTKRPENFTGRIHAAVCHVSGYSRELAHAWWCGKPPANVWVGTSVEDQTRADLRIPQIFNIPAKVRFLSCEPLLGAVDLRRGFYVGEEGGAEWAGAKSQLIDWVIAGGESGPGARPMHPDWARSLRDQCGAAGVSFLFKQWGEWAPCPIGDGPELVTDNVFRKGPGHDGEVWKVGKKAAGRTLDGVIHHAFPA